MPDPISQEAAQQIWAEFERIWQDIVTRPRMKGTPVAADDRERRTGAAAEIPELQSVSLESIQLVFDTTVRKVVASKSDEDLGIDKLVAVAKAAIRDDESSDASDDS